MSYSRFERKRFIKERMLYLMLKKGPLEPDGGYKLYEETEQMRLELDPAGNPATKRCAIFPLYKEALVAWQKARKIRLKSFAESRSL